jgi:hypothetical protein
MRCTLTAFCYSRLLAACQLQQLCNAPPAAGDTRKPPDQLLPIAAARLADEILFTLATPRCGWSPHTSNSAVAILTAVRDGKHFTGCKRRNEVK